VKLRPQAYLWYQWCLGFFLSFSDGFVSKLYLDKVGSYGEYNPFMKWMIDHYTIYSVIGLKLFLYLILSGLIMFVAKKSYTWISKTLRCLNVILGSVVGWGLFCLMSV